MFSTVVLWTAWPDDFAGITTTSLVPKTESISSKNLHVILPRPLLLLLALTSFISFSMISSSVSTDQHSLDCRAC